MNTILSNPKKELLLGAGLNIFHFESREWLDTIAFWKDEVRFFDVLLKKKETSEKTNSEYVEMLKNMDKIHADLFDDLEDRIVEHEKLLSRIEQSEQGLSDGDYREKHRHIHTRIEIFTNDFKTFKKIVFDYAKGL